MRWLTILSCSFLVIVLTILNPLHAVAGNIQDMTIAPDKSGRYTDISIVIDKHVGYRTFMLGNPRRLVIDFPDVEWRVTGVKTDPTGLITSYRHGWFENKNLRIVLEISRQVTIAKTETRVAGSNYKYIFHLQESNKDNLNQNIISPKAELLAPISVKSEPPAPVAKTELADDKPAKAAKKLIVIDAGHGGVDPGAIATNGIYEKNITLGVARALRDLLQETGRYRVKMTRDSDVFVILQDRVKIARRAKGDLFVSLHADTISRPAVQGASVYSLSDKASDAEAARLAERENQVDALVGGVNLGTQDKDVADILLDLVVRDNMNQSKILADTVVSGLRRGGVQTLEGSHRFAGFAVLKAPDIPSILVEMGYLSNPSEAARLNTDEHRQRIAQSILNAIDTYFNETSKKTEF